MYGLALPATTTDFRPALLASHGFATLGLDFPMGPENGEITNVTKPMELEYFESAVNLLLKHPLISSDGVGVYGISKGGSMALAIGAYVPGVRCVVAVNCSLFADHTPISYKGRLWKHYDLKFEELKEDTILPNTFSMFPTFKCPDDSDINMKDMIFEFYKRTDVAFHYTVSTDDRNTPSLYYAAEAERLLKKYNHQRYEINRYHGAGHLLEAPYHPLCQASFAPLINVVLVWGGEPEQHCRAQEVAWNKHLSFLGENLKPKSCKPSKL